LRGSDDVVDEAAAEAAAAPPSKDLRRILKDFVGSSNPFRIREGGLSEIEN